MAGVSKWMSVEQQTSQGMKQKGFQKYEQKTVYWANSYGTYSS